MCDFYHFLGYNFIAENRIQENETPDKNQINEPEKNINNFRIKFQCFFVSFSPDFFHCHEICI
jgi:hypothetical protein